MNVKVHLVSMVTALITSIITPATVTLDILEVPARPVSIFRLFSFCVDILSIAYLTANNRLLCSIDHLPIFSASSTQIANNRWATFGNGWSCW